MDSRPRLHGGRLFAGKTGGGGCYGWNDIWGRNGRRVRRDKAVWKVGARMKDGFQPLSSRGEGAPSREAPFGVRKRGWIPAFASSRGQALRGKVGCAVRMKDGFTPPSSRGQALRGGMPGEGGCYARESPLRRWRKWVLGVKEGIPAPVFTGAGSSREKRVGCAWVEGRAVLEPPLREGRVRLE